MTYEEYKEQEFLAIMTTWEGPTLEKLQELHPEHATRAKQEADERRGCTYEEYQARCAAYPDVILAPDQYGDYCYQEVKGDNK